MQPSTCTGMSFSLPIAAISVIGSTVPCAYEDAEPTSRMVLSLTAARIAATSARMPGVTLVTIGRTPKYSAALRKAAWAVMGSTISGCVISGRCCLAKSRAALTASRMLSVPPLVNAPTVPSPPPRCAAAMAMISFSKRSRLG